MKTKLFAILCTVLVIVSPLKSGDSKLSDENIVLLPVKNDPTISFRVWFKVGSSTYVHK